MKQLAIINIPNFVFNDVKSKVELIRIVVNWCLKHDFSFASFYSNILGSYPPHYWCLHYLPWKFISKLSP